MRNAGGRIVVLADERPRPIRREAFFGGYVQYEVFRDEASVWRWRILARGTARVIATSPGSYATADEAKAEMERVAKTLAAQLRTLDD